MKRHMVLSGMAVVLTTALLLSGCYHHMPPQAKRNSPHALSFRHVSKADRPGYTVAMVEDALRRYKSAGREATIAYYNSPASVDGEWYVFIFDEEDKAIAHPNQELIGQDLKGELGMDSAGYRFGDRMLEATEKGLWVDYLFLNPATGNQEYKHSWVVRHDGLIFVSGWYQMLPSSNSSISKENPAVYTIAFVDQAIRRYKAHGREEAFAYFSSSDSEDGAWYIFVIGEDDRVIAHPNHDFIGKDFEVDLGVDSTGYRWGDLMLSATEDGLWVDYVSKSDPTTDGTKEQLKHTWVVRYDGLIFGSGWYQELPSSNLGVSKENPAEYTIAFVDQAIRRYKALGREKAIAYFSNSDSEDDAWYIFIIDEEGQIIAHPVPDIIGMDLKGDLGVDSTGNRFSDLMLSATEDGLWVDYMSESDPTTDGTEEQLKHAWVVRYDGLIFGSGWYE